MTLDEFIAESHADVERFKAEWLKGDPEKYPRELAPEDWYDQFLTFVSTPTDADYIAHG